MDSDIERHKAAEKVAKVIPLVESLPSPAQTALWRAIDKGALGDGEIVRGIRKIIAEHLNGPRKAHAKRLFLTLWDPIMVRDPYLLVAGPRMTGLLHFYDLSGLWFALADSGGLRDQAERTQQWLERQCEEAPVDEILIRGPARGSREALRAAAVEALQLVSSAPITEQKKFLALVNGFRHRAVTEEIGVFDMQSLTPGDLAMFSASLAYAGDAAAFMPDPTTLLRRTDQEVAKGLVDAYNVLMERVGPSPLGQRIAMWPLMATAHRTNRFGIVLAALDSLRADDREDAREVLVRHALAWARCVHSALRLLLEQTHQTGAKPVLFSRPLRERLSQWVNRLLLLLPIVEQFKDVAEVDRKRCKQAIKSITELSVPELTEAIRLRIDRLDESIDEAPDVPDMVWFGEFSPKLRKLASPSDSRASTRGEEDRRLLETLDQTIRHLKEGPQQNQYFERLARLIELQTAFGGEPGRSISLINRRLITSAMRVLQTVEQAPDASVNFALLIAHQAGVERAAAREWRDPMLMKLGALVGELKLNGRLPKRRRMK
jgi:hypothetical protein